MSERKLSVTQGDITLLSLEGGALINPSNTGMILGSGVGEAITRRAGPLIQQTLHMKRSQLSGNRLQPGRAVETEPGELSAEQLVHVSILGADDVDERLISDCILNAYDLCDELELDPVAFPPLGVELAQFPIETFFELFLRISSEELPRANHIENVILCCLEEEDFDKAEEFFAEHGDELPDAIELEVDESGIGPGFM